MVMHVLEYARRPPRKSKTVSVCFNGFGDEERLELEELAKTSGLILCSRVTLTLSILCIGDNPTESKLLKADWQNTPVLTRTQFEHYLKTGEIDASRASLRLRA